MFAFLKYLPADYTLYSELRLNDAFHSQVEGLREKKPDFVVVGPDVGVVSIEVKDWNLDRSIYEWQDQRTVHKLDRQTGRFVADLDNPGAQVGAYRFGLVRLLETARFDGRVWVTSLLAFPQLTRQEFLSGTQERGVLQNEPQARFFIDMDSTLFRDDLERCVNHPETLLGQTVRVDSRFSPLIWKGHLQSQQ